MNKRELPTLTFGNRVEKPSFSATCNSERFRSWDPLFFLSREIYVAGDLSVREIARVSHGRVFKRSRLHLAPSDDEDVRFRQQNVNWHACVRAFRTHGRGVSGGSGSGSSNVRACNPRMKAHKGI